jgi:hypothetical protein
MRFKDIPRFTRSPSYIVNSSWDRLEKLITEKEVNTLAPLNLNPDFQRGHVWDEIHQIKYVEYKLRGGQGSNMLLFNCPGWMDDFRGPYVLVDGKQRIEAVRKFLRNELVVFNQYKIFDFEDELGMSPDFLWCINNLETRKEVLQWYLEINTGGVVHTEEELNKVRILLEKENASSMY